MVDEALDNVEGIPAFDKLVDVVPAMVSRAVSTPFFRSGHRASRLWEAYELPLRNPTAALLLPHF